MPKPCAHRRARLRGLAHTPRGAVGRCRAGTRRRNAAHGGQGCRPRQHAFVAPLAMSPRNSTQRHSASEDKAAGLVNSLRGAVSGALREIDAEAARIGRAAVEAQATQFGPRRGSLPLRQAFLPTRSTRRQPPPPAPATPSFANCDRADGGSDRCTSCRACPPRSPMRPTPQQHALPQRTARSPTTPTTSTRASANTEKALEARGEAIRTTLDERTRELNSMLAGRSMELGAPDRRAGTPCHRAICRDRPRGCRAHRWP